MSTSISTIPMMSTPSNSMAFWNRSDSSNRWSGQLIHLAGPSTSSSQGTISLSRSSTSGSQVRSLIIRCWSSSCSSHALRLTLWTSARVRRGVSMSTAFEANFVLPSCATLRNTAALRSTTFRSCTTPLFVLSSTSTLLLDQPVAGFSQQHRGSMQNALRPSARQEHSNGVIEGLGSSTIARLGPLRRRRSISCTDGNRVNFWERKITDSRGDPKKLWRNLKSVLRQKKEKPPSSEELTAEAFSNAFAEKLAGVRSSTASAAPPAFDNPPCISSFVRFETIDPSMILRLIRNAAGKSCELDPVPSWVIQKFADELSPFVAALFNASMSSGSFPSSQKTAAITPVLKKATLDPYDLGNYRPISNLTFLSKLLERAAYEQIVSYFDRYQLLPELQSAYRKHRSTETATIKVMSDVYEAADAGSITLLGLLDLSATFDTVDHRILLDRLGHDYGIGGLAIQWIESYLTGRSQFVRFNGVTSRTVPVTSGVPQGSVLGPILFISYSAAVIAIVQHHGFKVHAFADDLQIYGSTAQSGAADLMARMSNCVESVASWMSSNRLRLNPSKTELIWLGTSRRLQHCAGLTMSVCGADVRPVECVRDLGVLIDSNMTLLNHVNNVAGICFYQLRQLRIIRRSLTTEAAHSLVRALIHTRVDYCNGLLAAGPKYLHEKLPCVLRAAARLVLQLPHRASVSDIMRRQLHWLEMPDRIRFKLVFRCLHGLAPRYLSDLCTPATVHTHLRSSVTLERSLLVPRTKTKTIGPRGFYFASSAAWNALPVHLRDPGLSLNNFKLNWKLTFFLEIPHLGIMFSVFVARANVIIYKLARANIWIELNWIEFFWENPVHGK